MHVDILMCVLLSYSATFCLSCQYLHYQLNPVFTRLMWVTANMMNYNNTESCLSINTSFSTLPITNTPANRSGMGAYLERLAHLDEGLYNDFYGLWIALIVINSVIFLVGFHKASLLACFHNVYEILISTALQKIAHLEHFHVLPHLHSLYIGVQYKIHLK